MGIKERITKLERKRRAARAVVFVPVGRDESDEDAIRHLCEAKGYTPADLERLKFLPTYEPMTEAEWERTYCVQEANNGSD